MSDEALPLLESFRVAVGCIAPAIRAGRKLNVVISRSPFKVPTAAGELSFTIATDAINACVDDIIFIECDRTLQLPHPQQVAAILEEFVHVWFNVADEVLTPKIVALLYDGIRIVNGQYAIVEPAP
jgi:hypothetical protein